jgi:hypothetical protein
LFSFPGRMFSRMFCTIVRVYLTLFWISSGWT